MDNKIKELKLKFDEMTKQYLCDLEKMIEEHYLEQIQSKLEETELNEYHLQVLNELRKNGHKISYSEMETYLKTDGKLDLAFNQLRDWEYIQSFWPGHDKYYIVVDEKKTSILLKLEEANLL